MSTGKPKATKEAKTITIVKERGGVALTPYELFKEIQDNIKVNKTKWNGFSKFYYRSVEDIYNNWKALEVPLVLRLTDRVVEAGGRVFIEALAEVKDLKRNIVEYATAQAELGAGKAGMSSEQATGSASSYARKYALNGLFLLDDAKDPDEEETGATTATADPSEAAKVKLKIKELQDLIRGNATLTKLASTELKGRSLLKLTVEELDEIIKAINNAKETSASK